MQHCKSAYSFCLIFLSCLLFFPNPFIHAQLSTTNNPAMIENIVPININTATASELAEVLTGIGLNKAQNIVTYREKYGPFISIEQLKEVTGIGQSVLDKNRGKITY